MDRHWRWALGALLLLDAALLLYMGRGTTFFFDDWDFVTHDYGGGLHSLLAAHVGNISIFPVAVYKVLFHLVGLDHYAVFRLVVIVLHLIASVLVFTLCSRRLEPVPALLATALILLLGAAWEDLLWAFQVGYLLSIVGGLAAWVSIERRDRLGDLLAMAALVLAVGSSSLGIPLVIGVAVELGWRRDWVRAWVVLVPVLLYAIWYLGHGESQITANSLIHAPGFAADLVAAATGALVGRSLDWGRPLAVLALIVVLRRLVRPTPVSPRLAGLLATGAALWIVTAATRSTISSPETSRYLYLGAVVIVLVGVEMLQGVVLPARGVGVGIVLVLLFTLTGLSVMHDGALGLRSTSRTVTAELGALELAAAHAPPDYQPDPQRAPQIQAGPYLHTVRAIGSTPADDPAEILAADGTSRAAADGVLLALGVPQVVAASSPSALAPAPVMQTAAGGSIAQHGACAVLAPAPGQSMTAALVLPPGGVLIRDRGAAPTALSLRRFGDVFAALPQTIAAHGRADLEIPPDAAPTPWQLQTTSASALEICGLRA